MKAFSRMACVLGAVVAFAIGDVGCGLAFITVAVVNETIAS